LNYLGGARVARLAGSVGVNKLSLF
jgi:hypothetical protein